MGYVLNFTVLYLLTSKEENVTYINHLTPIGVSRGFQTF